MSLLCLRDEIGVDVTTIPAGERNRIREVGAEAMCFGTAKGGEQRHSLRAQFRRAKLEESDIVIDD